MPQPARKSGFVRRPQRLDAEARRRPRAARLPRLLRQFGGREAHDHPEDRHHPSRCRAVRPGTGRDPPRPHGAPRQTGPCRHKRGGVPVPPVADQQQMQPGEPLAVPVGRGADAQPFQVMDVLGRRSHGHAVGPAPRHGREQLGPPDSGQELGLLDQHGQVMHCRTGEPGSPRLSPAVEAHMCSPMSGSSLCICHGAAASIGLLRDSSSHASAGRTIATSHS